MALELNETATRVRCPDCAEWVDITIRLGSTQRRATVWVVAVSLDEDQFLADMTAHALASPEAHPTLVVVHA